MNPAYSFSLYTEEQALLKAYSDMTTAVTKMRIKKIHRKR